MTLQSTRRMCVPCGREMYARKNGAYVIELAGPPGQEWPYKLWEVDVWACPECNAQVATIGLRQRPLKQHGDDGLEEQVAKAQASRDCLYCWERKTDCRNPAYEQEDWRK